MTRTISIEKSLLYLSAGTGAIFLVFLIAFLWIQGLLVESQNQNKLVIAPVREATKSLRDALSDLTTRKAEIASATRAADVEALRSRQEEEARITSATATLRNTLPHLSASQTGDGQPPSAVFSRIEQSMGAFLAADQSFFDANLARRKHQEELEAGVKEVEGELKDFLQSVQGISGKIRFAYGSSVRRAKRIVVAHGFTPEAQAIIKDQILRASSLKNGIVSEILGSAGELNRLSAKISLLSNQDQLNSLLANELVQLRERTQVNLEDLASEATGQDDIVRICHDLEATLRTLAVRIMDLDNPKSLASLKRTVFTDLDTAAAAGKSLDTASASLRQGVGELVKMSNLIDSNFASGLGRAVASTRILLLILTLGAGAAGIAGGRVVRRNLRKLRQQNADLLRLKGELTELNAGLEAAVEERTRQIRTILDHVSFGLLLCDSELRIQPGYARSCSQILVSGDRSLERVTLTDLLAVDARVAEHFLALYQQIFELNPVLAEFAAEQLPSRFQLGSKSIGLTGSVVYDQQGRAERVLFCVADISELVGAELEIEKHRGLIKMLSNRDSFRQFVQDVGDSLQRLQASFPSADDSLIRRELHTLKGNMGVFKLSEIATQIHTLEGEDHITLDGIRRIESTFQTFLDQHRELLGVMYGVKSDDSYVVPLKLLEQVEGEVDAATNAEVLRRVFAKFLEKIRMKRARTVFGPLEESFALLALRLGKQANLIVTGAETLVPASAVAILRGINHLLRNALDHGIEPAAQRQGKSETGTIALTISADDSSLQIEVQDDGRGLVRSKIIEKAKASGLVSDTQISAMSDAEVDGLIFLEGLTTAETVTDVSGRGVGMSAVKHAVDEAGGTIRIASKPGTGTTITINVPTPLHSRMRATRQLAS